MAPALIPLLLCCVVFAQADDKLVMRVDLSRQGTVQGNYTKHKIKGIPLLSMSNPPKDQQKGRRREHELSVRLRMGKNSPAEKMLSKAYSDRELASSVVIYSYSAGKQEALHKEWVLTNATISSKTQAGEVEEIKFSYQKIRVDTVTGGKSFSDDWQNSN